MARSPPSSPPSHGAPSLAIGALYVASIPLSIRSYCRLRRSAEELRLSTAAPGSEAAADPATAGDHPGH